jgi:hypothetical protein
MRWIHEMGTGIMELVGWRHEMSTGIVELIGMETRDRHRYCGDYGDGDR